MATGGARKGHQAGSFLSYIPWPPTHKTGMQPERIDTYTCERSSESPGGSMQNVALVEAAYMPPRLKAALSAPSSFPRMSVHSPLVIAHHAPFLLSALMIRGRTYCTGAWSRITDLRPGFA